MTRYGSTPAEKLDRWKCQICPATASTATNASLPTGAALLHAPAAPRRFEVLRVSRSMRGVVVVRTVEAESEPHVEPASLGPASSSSPASREPASLEPASAS